MVNISSLHHFGVVTILRRTGIIVFLLLISCVYAAANNLQAYHRVLYISSYSLSFPSAIEQYQGIMSVLDKPNIIIDTEYMDCKRFPEKDNLVSFKKRLVFSLSKLPRYDAIITGDDAALQFVLDNYKSLFYHIPVFFMGVNNVKLGLAQDKNPYVTGLLEIAPFEGTVDIMLKLYPKSKRIYVVSDHSTSGYNDYHNLLAVMPRFKGVRCEILWFDHYSVDEFCKKLSSLDKSVPLCFLSAYEDKNGKTFSFKDVINMMKLHHNVPIFYAWSMGIRYGTFGGLVISHYDQGRIAAQMVERMFDGFPVANMRVIEKTPYRYMFDYRQLSEFGIDEDNLPGGSILVDAPVSFYEQNKIVVISTIVFILILVVMILLLIKINLQRRQTTKELVVSKVKAEEGDRLKTEFIRNLSHEIKTPLHGILGFADLLSADSTAKDDNETYIKVIHDNVNRLMDIIHKVFEISSLESHTEIINIGKVSVRDLLSDQYIAFKEHAFRKSLSFSYDNEDSKKDYVIDTDAAQLSKIVGYLRLSRNLVGIKNQDKD